MKTVKEVLSAYKKDLDSLYDPREAEAIALLVLEEQTGYSKAKLKAFPEQELSDAQQDYLNDALTRLTTGEPIQYIIGHTEFYGLKFKVDPSVLIPRPETEELVEWILSDRRGFESLPQNPFSILDIGTGSGCIAITLKKHLPDAAVEAMDISVSALYTAKENAELNQVEVNFIRQDILNMPDTPPSSGEDWRASLIVSNPPYVTITDKTQMHTNVTDFEPHNALFVPEDDPLIFYRAIAEFATQNLKEEGLLFFEINENLGPETVSLLAEKGFSEVTLRQDLSGRDRMIRARIVRQR